MLLENIITRYSLYVIHVVLDGCTNVTNRGLAALGECRNMQSVRARACPQLTVRAWGDV